MFFFLIATIYSGMNLPNHKTNASTPNTRVIMIMAASIHL